MSNPSLKKRLFLVAALYDELLGLGFLFGYQSIYALLGIPVPENPAYLHLAAALVFVQGVGYHLVYRNTEPNADLVRLGIIYKAAFAGVAFYALAVKILPHPIFALFATLDLVFLVLFARHLKSIKGVAGPAAKPAS